MLVECCWWWCVVVVVLVVVLWCCCRGLRNAAATEKGLAGLMRGRGMISSLPCGAE